uniref:Uncharacterized protein n=1 Tax=Rhizophora mucronata TaxID=61149 RepID=A0A2P2MHK8_RHIMU
MFTATLTGSCIINAMKKCAKDPPPILENVCIMPSKVFIKKKLTTKCN